MKMRFDLFVVSLACLGSSGCVLASVSFVGAAAKDLGAHPAALAGMSRYCVTSTMAMGGSLPGASPSSCAQLEKDAVFLKKAVKMLSDYGTTLQTIAGSKTPDVESDFKGILTTAGGAGWVSLTKDQSPALAAAAGSLATFILTTWKEQKVREVVKAYDPDVKVIVARITEIIQLQETNIDIARTTALARAQASVRLAMQPPPGAPPVPIDVAQAAAFGAGEFAETAKVELAELDALRTSVEAFGKAHATLAAASDHLGDKALLAELEVIVTKIFEVAKAFEPPAAVGAPAPKQ
jgi:hypothetical protein